ncbi:MAG: gfo/Idh/MocA family oxidoreductase [Bacteroidetes bacterium]|nr:MAG: gfo/Idh/MocA family oxidoreductase [Bacteroidota bacterium]
MPTRRQFLGDSSRLALAASIGTLLPLGAQSRTAPSDKVRIALVGCGGMGMGDLENHLKQPGVVCAGLCDVDQKRLESAAARVEKMNGQKPTLYKDFRKLLENKDIDAVIIGTPDHWHCLIMVMACQAGKDVYVEKPMANSIAECEVMVKAARRYGRVVQVGQQQRSGKNWQEIVAFVQSGKLGKIRQVRLFGHFDYGMGAPRIENSTPPSELDYELWLGPAPFSPYNANRLHGVWRHQWHYGGGLLSDWGVHLLDIPLWAMKVEGAPQWVNAAGGIFVYPERQIETADTLNVSYAFEDWTLTWEHIGGSQTGLYNRNYGMAFIGANGTLVANREGWELLPVMRDNKYIMEALPPQKSAESNHEAHAINFLECIKSRKDPACTVEMGYLAAFYAHMGNISYRSGTRLKWDASRQNFGENKAANALITPEYRAPWELPKL